MEATASLLDAAAVGDLVLLDPLTEESLLQTLQERFRHGHIYVGTGARGRGGRGVCGGEQGAGCGVGPRGLRWGAGCGLWSGEHGGPGWVLPAPYPRRPACPQTYIGNVVISVNPYQPLPIYTPEKVQEYHNCNFFAVKPHM